MLVETWTEKAHLMRSQKEMRKKRLENREKQSLVLKRQGTGWTCSCPSVLWKVELREMKLDNLAEEVPKQSVEGMAWILITAYCEIQKEGNDFTGICDRLWVLEGDETPKPLAMSHGNAPSLTVTSLGGSLLAREEMSPFLTRPPDNLFPMQRRHPAQDQSEDQAGSPLRSHRGVKTITEGVGPSF